MNTKEKPTTQKTCHHEVIILAYFKVAVLICSGQLEATAMANLRCSNQIF
jgi:hypothetical protein